MAVYPSSIKQFTTKRDVYDVNYAADINALQDEIRAIEMVLGINPHVANLNSGTVNYPNVASRLDSLERGESTLLSDIQNIPVDAPPPPPTVSSTAVLTCSVYSPYQVVNAQDKLSIVLNNASWDTGVSTLNQGQADGIGITIRRSGFYHIEASGRFGEPVSSTSVQMMSVRDGSSNEIIGAYGISQNFTPGASGTPGALRLNASGIARLAVGTTLRLWFFNEAAHNIAVANASLTTWFLSEG